MKEEKKQERIKSEFEEKYRGCLITIVVIIGSIFLLWFIFVERNFIFIRPKIYGKIIDKETKKPIENALVVFAWRSSGSGWREYDATITDKKGYYKLPTRLVLSYPKHGPGEWAVPFSLFIEERSGCVLVSWFPGYFRSEKHKGGKVVKFDTSYPQGQKEIIVEGKKLISGRQDFELQRAKTREEVVASLEENVSPHAGFYTWRGIYGSAKAGIKTKFYNSKNIDLKKIYERICEEDPILKSLKNHL
jgi:hypothetical protein